MVSYGKCCYPIPGDDVMGYLTAGMGVVIHRNQCGNLSTSANSRRSGSRWAGKRISISSFPVPSNCDTRNKPGVLAEVAATIADCSSNIEQVEVLGRHEDCSVLSFLICR